MDNRVRDMRGDKREWIWVITLRKFDWRQLLSVSCLTGRKSRLRWFMEVTDRWDLSREARSAGFDPNGGSPALTASSPQRTMGKSRSFPALVSQLGIVSRHLASTAKFTNTHSHTHNIIAQLTRASRAHAMPTQPCSAIIFGLYPLSAHSRTNMRLTLLEQVVSWRISGKIILMLFVKHHLMTN